MDETAFRRTTATSEEEDLTWIRVRKEELHDLQDKARFFSTQKEGVITHDGGSMRHIGSGHYPGRQQREPDFKGGEQFSIGFSSYT